MYSNCKKYKLIKSVCVEISVEKNKKRWNFDKIVIGNN